MPVRLLIILFLFTVPVKAQFELPGTFNNTFKSIPQGSLIIAMDTANQFRPGYFNLKSYGLICHLLENEIPVHWAIRKGKTRATVATQVDFSGNVTRVFPDTGNAANTSFNSGPFIVDSAWVSKAIPVINAYKNNVNIYRLNATTNVDVRYTLTFKPRICLLNMGGFDTISVRVLQEAGVPASMYQLRSPLNQIFTPSDLFSLISEQHYSGTDTARINPIIRYLSVNGGNVIASCASLGSIENTAKVMTTGGIDSVTSGISGVAYFNIDLPTAQFHGNLITPNGDYKYWQPKSGSTFKTTSAYQIVRSGNGTGFYLVTGSKLQPVGRTGGVISYLPGHSYYTNVNATTDLETVRINGRRIFLNHMFIPPGESIAANLDFTTDVAISLIPQTGFAVKNETFNIQVIASNNGPGRAKAVKINAPSFAWGLVPGSFSLTKGVYNVATGTWLLDSLGKGQADTLNLTFTISQLGPIQYAASIATESYETFFPNNYTSLDLYGVSRPEAVRDTVLFNTTSFIQYPVKVNDSDEDTGPFHVSQILQGPFHGTASLLGDSVRYYLGAGFSGTDSLLYLLCDQLPLCDSAWVYYYIPSPLPVTFGHFSGTRKDGHVNLSWNTLSEKDNDYFRLFRSEDGKNFTVTGNITAVGNSNSITWYNYQDQDNLAPVLYYRLYQHDLDGKRTDLGIIALPRRQADQQFTLFPNPSQHEIIIQAGNIYGDIKLVIADLAGRKLKEIRSVADSSGQLSEIISVEGWPPGVYIATLQTKEEITSIKMMIR